MSSVLESAPVPSAAENFSPPAPAVPPTDRPRLAPILYFGGIHVACLAGLWVGVSWTAVLVCLALYALRMFAITAGYHRYFSHRTYYTSRAFRFLLGVLGTLAIQKGPLWWASVHRHHHRASRPPRRRPLPDPEAASGGRTWAGSSRLAPQRHRRRPASPTRLRARAPPARPVPLGPPVLLASASSSAASPRRGAPRARHVGPAAPRLGLRDLDGARLPRGLVRELDPPPLGQAPLRDPGLQPEQPLVALYTFGEGWHNNHHRFPRLRAAGLLPVARSTSPTPSCKLLSLVRLVWDLKRPPQTILDEGRS